MGWLSKKSKRNADGTTTMWNNKGYAGKIPAPVTVPDSTPMNSTVIQEELPFTDLQALAAAVPSTPIVPKWLETKPDGSLTVNRKDLAIEMSKSKHPVMLDAIAGMPFDAAQVKDLLYSRIGDILFEASRSGDNPLEEVPQAEWQAWNLAEAELVKETNPAAARELEDLADKPAPRRIQLEMLRGIRVQAKHAPESLEREIRFLAAVNDIGVDDAREAYLKARADYNAAPWKQKPTTPRWHTTAVYCNYLYEYSLHRPPADRATSYALYAVHTDQARTAHYSKKQRPVVVFDTETTDATENASIIQLTAIRYDPEGREERRLSTLLNPGVDADGKPIESAPQALATHHITSQQTSTAPSFADIAGELSAMLNDDDPVLVAHNIRFDQQKVNRDLESSGQKGIREAVHADTMFLARIASPKPKDTPSSEYRFTLAASCERAGIPFSTEEAHDASYDVSRTALLFRSLRHALPSE